MNSPPYIVIDSDNYAASGIETLFFPGGEPHAKVPKFDKPVLFVAKCRTWNDTGLAACVWDALIRQEVEKSIFLPYFPAARQDRSMGEAPRTADLMLYLFGVTPEYTAGSVHTFDVHSDFVEQSVEKNWMPADVPDWGVFGTVLGVIAPDEGAIQRALQFQEWFAPIAEFIQCTKERDPKTGRLSNYKFPETRFHKAGRYIVVDDICDGGGTFNLLAEAFEKVAPPEIRLELFVSHGIFSKGLKAISPRYSKIYTTDSWFDWNEPGARWMDRRLEVRSLTGLYDKIMGVYRGL